MTKESDIRSPMTIALSSIIAVGGIAAAVNALRPPMQNSIPESLASRILIAQVATLFLYLLLTFPAAKFGEQAGPHFGAVLGLGALAVSSVVLSIGALRSRDSAGLLLMICGAALVHVSESSRVANVALPGGRTASKTLAQGFVSMATIGPWICAPLLVQESLHGAPPAWQFPYAMAAVAFGTLAVFASRFRRSPSRDLTSARGLRESSAVPFRWKWPAVFCITGCELAISCSVIGLCMLPENGGISFHAAAGYFLLYWSGLTAGRMWGQTLVSRRIVRRVVGSAAVAACLLIAASIGFSGKPAIWSLILAGTAVSLTFPGIFAAEAIRPANEKVPVCWPLLPALLGAILVPLAEYALARRIGLQAALGVPAVCCLYAVFYGFARLRRDGGECARECSIDIARPRRRDK